MPTVAPLHHPHPDAGRYSFEALVDAVAAPSIRILAARIGVHERQLYRWRHAGLSVWKADRVACALGLHPANIWPEWATDPQEAA